MFEIKIKNPFLLINKEYLDKLFKDIRYIIEEKEIGSLSALIEINELIRLFEIQLNE